MVPRNDSAWSVQVAHPAMCSSTPTPSRSPSATNARSSGSGWKSSWEASGSGPSGCGTVHLPTLPELNQGSPDVALDRADGQPGGRGDLGMAQLTVEGQQDDPSLFGGQLVQLVADHHPVDHPIGGCRLDVGRGDLFSGG